MSHLELSHLRFRVEQSLSQLKRPCRRRPAELGSSHPEPRFEVRRQTAKMLWLKPRFYN